MDQKEVDHTSDRVGAVHSRGAILEDVHVIDHGKRKQVNVHASAGSGSAQRTVGDPFAIDQNQSLLGQQAAQVELDGTVTAVADVHVHPTACFLRDEFLQVGCISDAQLLDVLRSVRVHGIRPGLFRCRNVRTGHNHAFNFSGWRWHTRRCWNSRSRQLSECVGCKN